MYEKIDRKIEDLNDRIAIYQMRVIRLDAHLYLEGIFPPQPGSDRLRPHKQTLPLDLLATPEGLQQAREDVIAIGGSLASRKFDWQDYAFMLNSWKRIDQLTLAEQFEAFEKWFRLEATLSDSTWQHSYLCYLKRVEAAIKNNSDLSLAEAIYSAIQSTEPDSRSRQSCCTALKCFADYLKLQVPFDFKMLFGNYSHGKVRDRKLPSDDLIVETWAKIPNLQWRYVYALMAVYGLRNHECFLCDLSELEQEKELPVVKVLAGTKTGEHIVYPFHPEWIETFKLRGETNLPTIGSNRTPQRIGQRVTSQFRRYGVPFSPYDLRHAWAVRTIHYGIPDPVSAKMMGHTINVHTRVYQKHLTHRDQEAAVRAALTKYQLKAPALEEKDLST